VGVVRQRLVQYASNGGWVDGKRERERTSKPITNSFTEPGYGCGCKSSHHAGGFAAGVRESFSGSARSV